MSNNESHSIVMLAKYDDGSQVDLDCYTGGAHPDGAWAEIGLLFTDAHGNETRRRYRDIALKTKQALVPPESGLNASC